MKLVAYGNACFSLFHRGLHVLCDPWLDGPAVAGGWAKFPPSPVRARDLPPIDLIYISHIHSDHCEATTLEQFDRDVPIVLLDLKPGFLEKMLRGRGFTNLHVVPQGECREVIPGVRAELFAASFEHICADVIDSSMLLDFGDRRVLNCNDNKPGPELCAAIERRYGRVDLALLPAAGGSGYPAMYENLSAAEKAAAAAAAVEKYTRLFVDAVDALHPQVAVPVAGGYAIRGPYAENVNYLQARRFNHLELVDIYAANGRWPDVAILPMQPGMEVTVEQKAITAGAYHVWTAAELRAHFSALAHETVEPKVHATVRLRALPALVRTARQSLWQRQQALGRFPAYRVYLQVEGYPEHIEIALDSPEVRVLRPGEEPIQPYLRMRLSQDTLVEWVLGVEDFNMLDSGHRISFFREPNEYVVEVYFLMSYLRLA